MKKLTLSTLIVIVLLFTGCGNTFSYMTAVEKNQYLDEKSKIYKKAEEKTVPKIEPEKESLILGSNIKIVKNYKGLQFTLSNNTIVTIKELKNLREFASKFNIKNDEVLNLLTKYTIEIDKVDNRYVIKPDYNTYKNYEEAKLIEPMIIIKNDKASFNYSINYRDEDWLFVNSFKIASNEINYFVKKDFNRDVLYGGEINEWAMLPVNNKTLSMLEELSKNEEVLIKFYGSKYYNTKVFIKLGKIVLSDFIKIYRFIK